jgi:hypothetical protein
LGSFAIEFSICAKKKDGLFVMENKQDLKETSSFEDIGGVY